MIVVWHEAIGMYPDAPHGASLTQKVDESLIVRFVSVNPLACSSAVHDVIVGTWVLNSYGRDILLP